MKRLLLLLVALTLPSTAYAQFPSQNITLPAFVVPASAVTGGGTVTSAQLLLPDGTAALPGLAFASDPDTGIFHDATANTFIVSAGGAAITRFTSTSINILSNSAALRLGASADASIEWGAANRVDVATGDSLNLVGGGGALLVAAVPVISSTAPTVTSAGTSPSVAGTNTAAFRVNVGTGGTATTIVLAMPAATTGWNCDASNITGAAANRANQHIVQQSSTTTAATLQNQTISTGAALAFTASDIVRVICFAY